MATARKRTATKPAPQTTAARYETLLTGFIELLAREITTADRIDAIEGGPQELRETLEAISLCAALSGSLR